MSRITQLAEMRALREDVNNANKRCAMLEVEMATLVEAYNRLVSQVHEAQAKRGPGRPKNDDRITARSN